MRDGVKLFTVAFTPKDTATNYPILLQRTPYNLKPYTIDAGDKPGGLPDSYVREKFIFALQDVRGRFASEGEFVDVRPHKPIRTVLRTPMRARTLTTRSTGCSREVDVELVDFVRRKELAPVMRMVRTPWFRSGRIDAPL